MPRHKKSRYHFHKHEHARFEGVVHEVHSSWFDPAEQRGNFITLCGAIIHCKGSRRTTHPLSCIVCIDGGIFGEKSIRRG